MKKQILGLALFCIITLLAVPFTANCADKLLVKDAASNTQFVVTDDGKLGLGTGTPAYTLTVSKTGSNPSVVAKRTGGAGSYMISTPTYAGFGSLTNHPVYLNVKGVWKMQINADSSITTAANGAHLTAGGVWTDGSSREFKENIVPLTAADADAALKALSPVQYNYKVDKNERHVGFIAEDVPELVATQDRKSLSPMDIVAVLTKVVQEKSQIVEEQQKTLEALSATVARLEREIKRLQLTLVVRLKNELTPEQQARLRELRDKQIKR